MADLKRIVKSVFEDIEEYINDRLSAGFAGEIKRFPTEEELEQMRQIFFEG